MLAQVVYGATKVFSRMEENAQWSEDNSKVRERGREGGRMSV